MDKQLWLWRRLTLKMHHEKDEKSWNSGGSTKRTQTKLLRFHWKSLVVSIVCTVWRVLACNHGVCDTQWRGIRRSVHGYPHGFPRMSSTTSVARSVRQRFGGERWKWNLGVRKRRNGCRTGAHPRERRSPQCLLHTARRERP